MSRASFTGDFSSVTMQYTGSNGVSISIGRFTQTGAGVVLVDHSETGMNWFPLNLQKRGWGIITNCTGSGPAVFTGSLTGPGYLRVHVQDTVDMEPIAVEIRFGDVIGRHVLRGESKFVIEEAPDLRDLLI